MVLPSFCNVEVACIINCNGESASGLIAVLVRRLIEDVVFSFNQQLTGHFGRHHVADFHVIRKNRLFPKDLISIN